MKIYKLKEAKTNQLKKLYLNGNIDEKQFETADKFFKTHSAYEKEIDWNRGLKITWDDLEKVIKKERGTKSQTRKSIKKGLKGFEEGKDYLVIGEGKYDGETWVAYQPFTWEASRMIASHYVEPFRNEKGDLEDAEWCTSYQKVRRHWDKHSKIEAFIYLCGESIPTKKVAISISEEKYDANDTEFLYFTGNLNFNIWDFDDDNDTIGERELLKVVPDLYDLIEKAYKYWDDKYEEIIFSKLRFNPQTNKYDCDGDLDRYELGSFFLLKDKSGFTVNFGKILGYFDCSGLGLKSLKGAPTEVRGYFHCYSNQLISLKGSPQTVGGAFDCSDNYLTSLEGAPQTIGGVFDYSNNKFMSLGDTI